MDIDQVAEIELPQEFANVMKRFMPSLNLEDDIKEEEAPVKKEKKQKISLSELKKLAKKPENVEWVDCDAKDPLFLVEIKSSLNTIPVPAHWSSKRKYLQSKRGIEKLPYELPPYIKETNISELRQAGKDKEDQQKLKQKVRARLHGKIHKLEIDYQILHDSFFKHQEKPPMTKFGEVFYEGKEFELKIKAQRAGGELSDELKRALGMGPKDPPPFLYNMQRYGPPPSYSLLKIPGVNAPIPKTASWGFHNGGYGKPPVDLHGRALYGDVFGIGEAKKVKSKHWIQPEPRWGEFEKETADDMDIDKPQSLPKLVDMQDDKAAATKSIPIRQVGQKEEKKHYKRIDKSGESNISKPLYTVVEEEERRIGDEIVGNEKGYKFENKDANNIKGNKSQLPDQKNIRKRPVNNNNQNRKKFKY